MMPDLRETRKALREFTDTVLASERLFDAELAKPSSYERGRRLAQILNGLTMARQIAERHGLGRKGFRK